MADSGDTILHHVEVRIATEELVSKAKTNTDGEYTIGNFESGAFTLRLATDDGRYAKKEVTVELEDGAGDTVNI